MSKYANPERIKTPDFSTQPFSSFRGLTPTQQNAVFRVDLSAEPPIPSQLARELDVTRQAIHSARTAAFRKTETPNRRPERIHISFYDLMDSTLSNGEVARLNHTFPQTVSVRRKRLEINYHGKVGRPRKSAQAA